MAGGQTPDSGFFTLFGGSGLVVLDKEMASLDANYDQAAAESEMSWSDRTTDVKRKLFEETSTMGDNAVEIKKLSRRP